MLEYVVDTKHIKGKLWVNAVYLTDCQEKTQMRENKNARKCKQVIGS